MQSPTSKLNLEVHGHTAVLTINNPSANTWDMESLGALPYIVSKLNENLDIWSLVLTGQGPKFFSAGADLKIFKDGDKAAAATMADLFGRAFEALSEFRGVSIAAINGFAMGGGLEAAMSCDLRVAEEHAQMALPEASVGLMPCAGGTQNLPWIVGESWAKRMMLLGERVDAATALRIGLVEEVVASGKSLERAIELAKKVENQSPRAVGYCKKMIQSARHQPMFSTLAHEREAFVRLFDTKDQIEGVSAFLEKRKASWKNA